MEAAVQHQNSNLHVLFARELALLFTTMTFALDGTAADLLLESNAKRHFARCAAG